MSTKEQAFDPMSFKPSEEQSKGKAPLPRVGLYENILIDNIEPMEVDTESQYYKGELANYRVTFKGKEGDPDLSRYMKLTAKFSKKSTLHKLYMAAAQEGLAKELGDKELEAAVQALAISDLIGRRIDIFIAHDQMDNGTKYADYNFMPRLKK